VSLNAVATAGLSVGADGSPLALAEVTGARPVGGVFAGAGVEGGVFDPALAAEGANVLTYTVGTEQVSFTVTVTPAPVVPTVPNNALTAVLAGSVVVSDNGTATGVGGAEIPAFDPASKRAFSASNAGIQVIDLTNPGAPVRLAPIDPTVLGLTTKDVSHVVVKNGVLAASLIASPDKTLPGTVAFFAPATGALLGSVTVGAVPDQLIFTPDGTKVLVANEGEMTGPVVAPAPAPADPDPVGSVSIIDVSGGFASPTVMTAGFAAFDGQESALRAAGVRVFPGRAASRDLEPEYIAVSPDGMRAMVTLQEAMRLRRWTWRRRRSRR
jgi:DNA-binding beta-propeller fold protein YncE